MSNLRAARLAASVGNWSGLTKRRRSGRQPEARVQMRRTLLLGRYEGGMRSFLVVTALSCALGCSSPSESRIAVPKGQAIDAPTPGISVVDCDGCPPMVQVPALRPSGTLFHIARHELTWREYLPAVRESGCKLPELRHGRTYPPDLATLADDYPVTSVAPNDFTCYLKWISRKTGKRYRLPTGAEWEHAARAGTSSKFPWGDALGFDNAAVWEHFNQRRLPPFQVIDRDPRSSIGVGRTVLPAESFRPNAWGLYDVVGNVAEYVADQWPGPGTCLKLKDEASCRLQVSRGGKTETVAWRVGVGMVGYDYDFLNEEQRWFAFAAQSPGYRIARD